MIIIIDFMLRLVLSDEDYQFSVNVDGVALSPIDSNFNRLYFCPLSSANLFSVSTSILRTAVNGDNLSDSAVRNEGLRTTQSDGLSMDYTGLLFAGLLGKNGVAYYNTSSNEKVKCSSTKYYSTISVKIGTIYYSFNRLLTKKFYWYKMMLTSNGPTHLVSTTLDTCISQPIDYNASKETSTILPKLIFEWSECTQEQRATCTLQVKVRNWRSLL